MKAVIDYIEERTYHQRVAEVEVRGSWDDATIITQAPFILRDDGRKVERVTRIKVEGRTIVGGKS